MRRLRSLTTALLSLHLAGSLAFGVDQAARPKSAVEVVDLKLCQEVKDREPVNEIQIAKVGETVTGWSRVRSGVGKTEVSHRWLRDGDKVFETSFKLTGSPYRSWSKKTLRDAGEWRFQVVNTDGLVLKEISFRVTQ